jgi:hypothetical protein
MQLELLPDERVILYRAVASEVEATRLHIRERGADTGPAVLVYRKQLEAVLRKLLHAG